MERVHLEAKQGGEHVRRHHFSCLSGIMSILIPYIGVHQTSIAILYEIYISRTRLLRTNFIHFGVQYAVSRHMGGGPRAKQYAVSRLMFENLAGPTIIFDPMT